MNKKDLLGYGAATFADSAPYNFVTVYLILFLTTVVGMSPEVSGTVSSVIILADGVVGALIGYVSDNIRWKYGRRRPFLLAAVAPLVIGLILLFTKVEAGAAVQSGFYIIVGLMFWLGFSMYYTPYSALGAELTDDYDERSILRTIARLFGIFGNFIGMVIPLLFVQYMQTQGMAESRAWFFMAAILAVIAGGSILVTWKSTKGKEQDVSGEPGEIRIGKLISEYIQVLKLKPFKHMIIVIGMYIVANTFYNSSMVFFTRYNLGMGDEITSTIFLISIIANLVYTPVMGVCAVKFGKKNTLAMSMLIAGAAGVVFYFIGIHSYVMMVVYVVIYSISYTCFWQLINAIMYDITEVGEFVLGKRLEGSITSVYGLAFTVFTSAATQIVGWLLKLDMVNAAFILLPGLCLIAAAIAQFIYPINGHTFELLKKAVADKKAGKPVDMNGLERIL